MNAEDFIDTNVLIYLFDETNADKRQLAESLVYRSLRDGTGCISYQVIQETLNVVISKLGASAETAQRLLDDILIPLWQVDPTPDIYRSAVSLRSQFGFSFYDSLIVAASIAAGCVRLYTEDMQHGQKIQNLTIQNPFA